MSRDVALNIGVLNVYCGYNLTVKEREVLIRLSIAEFDKPIKDRKIPFQLVEEAKRIVKFKKWHNG